MGHAGGFCRVDDNQLSNTLPTIQEMGLPLLKVIMESSATPHGTKRMEGEEGTGTTAGRQQ